jgi:septum site-determining protein MinC
MHMSRKPIEIKISTVVAVCAILNETDPVALDQALKQMTGGSTDFFEDEFAVVDVSGLDLATQTIDWKKLVKLFKQYRLNIVAVRNAAPEFHAKITAQGLSIDSVQVRAPEVTPAPPPTAPEPVPEAPVVPAAQTMYIDTPIRAGQRIYARGGDLVIMAAVNNGAEVIADGSIHIYAPLRGRALAGASGNTQARIIAASLEAELVSIAGIYRTFEDGTPAELAQQQVQIRLTGDRIDVLPLKNTK